MDSQPVIGLLKHLALPLIALASLVILPGCDRSGGAPVLTVYCAVDEPYASKLFEEFTEKTGIQVAPLYDIESSKSIGLAGKLEAESNHPHADVWWGSEAFLTTRLASEGILDRYDSPSATDIAPQYKNPQGFWAGVAVRARVLAVGQPPPGFPIKGLNDLLDPRLKGKIAMAHPTAGVTGAHIAALYVTWGPQKTLDFFRKLHANGVTLLGGNAEVADQVGAGSFELGLTDSDSVTTAAANGGKLTTIVPDQDTDGTLAMPTTVALVKGGRHPDAAKKLIDFLLSREAEQRLIDMNFARWSVRAGPNGIKPLDVDYRKAAEAFGPAVRQIMDILDGSAP